MMTENASIGVKKLTFHYIYSQKIKFRKNLIVNSAIYTVTMIGSARAIYINITCKNFNNAQCDRITEDKLLTQGKL